jgi:hypothetical protein
MKESPIYLLAIILMLSSCVVDDSSFDTNCEEWTISCTDTSLVLDAAKANRKVLIIGIDGFRADAMQESITPLLFGLATNQNTYYTDQNHVERLTFSGPNWSTLCNGVQFCKHEVKSNDFEDNRLDMFPHFFRYVEQAYPEKNTLSIVNWTPINEHLAGTHADYAPIDGIDDHDVFLIAQNALELGVPSSPDVLFLQFDELDGAGHSYGFHPNVPEYASKLTELDAYIETLLTLVDAKRQSGEDWLVCVISDHGGEGTGHGDQPDDDNVNRTIMFMNSTSESFNQWYTSSQRDLVPTVMDFMGIESAEFNCKTDGISVLAD